jgi:hypothetical protein
MQSQRICCNLTHLVNVIYDWNIYELFWRIPDQDSQQWVTLSSINQCNPRTSYVKIPDQQIPQCILCDDILREDVRLHNVAIG